MLRELQQTLSRAFSGDADSAEALLSELVPLPTATAARGLALYQGALRHVVEDALGEMLPVCRALVGEACFAEVARRYAAAHPSRHPDLGRLGEALPAWLPTLAFLDSVPYLADMARLELALHAAADAPEPPPVPAPESLARALSEAPEDFRFTLHPSIRLIESEHPIHAIWCAHQPEAEESDWEIAPVAGGERLVAWRSPERGLTVDPIAAGRRALFDLLLGAAGRRSVARALEEAAAQIDPKRSESVEALLLGAIEEGFARGWLVGVAPAAAR